MTGRNRTFVLAAAVATATLLAGCGTATTSREPAAATVLAPPSLNMTLVTGAGTWAAVEMGGSAAQYNNFWQLFIQPTGSARWSLVTPPGTADNGGLVLAGTSGKTLISAFLPNQLLTFTPLIQTTDGGKAWSSLNPLDAPLASVPDALASNPASGHQLALLADGTAEEAAAGSATWTVLAGEQTLAGTAAGQRCGLRKLTAAAYTSAGTPMLAGTCADPGIAGIFAASHGTWQPAGPAMPAAVARQDITVLRLTQTAHGITALLAAGTGPTATLLAAWSADGGARWTTSPPLKLGGAKLSSASFGPDGTAAIVLTGNHAETISSTQPRWRALPALPAGTLTLAPGQGGMAGALAVDRSILTVWQLAPGGKTWTKAQVINVPIPYGSSS